MTLNDAKKKAVELEGCEGFCFKGFDAEWDLEKEVEVVFKNKWDIQQGRNPWTSYKVVRQEAVFLSLFRNDGSTRL